MLKDKINKIPLLYSIPINNGGHGKTQGDIL